ncbi:YoaK family protein [uncultured Hymenobacter sp.]|uniref:YoaK family protein n=1 Tax=uncultured Hymenobacter sp. TaxID=170016 RepID=UPI0035CC2E61
MADYPSVTAAAPGPAAPAIPAPVAAPGPAIAPVATLSFTLALVALSGYVDAVSYLRYNKLYVSFMTGNTTSLGVAIAKHDASEVMLLFGVIALFVTGVMAGNLLARRAGPWSRTLILLVVAALLLLAGVWPAGAIACLVLAMGALNATVHKEGSVAVSLTYVTGTLVHFGAGLADLVSGRAPEKGWPGPVTFWLAFLGGALAGGALLVQWGALALPVAVGCSLLLALVAWRVRDTQ